MAGIKFVPAEDGSGRMVPELNVQPAAATPAPPKELTDDEVFGAAPAGPKELSDADVFGTAAPTTTDKVEHVAGLAGRAGVQAIPSAILGLPALAMDAYDSLDNAIRLPYNGVAGLTGLPKVPYIPAFRHGSALADVGNMAASAIGLPKPQTKMEQGLTDIGAAGLSALGGAAGFSKLGSMLPKIPNLLPDVVEAGHAFSQAPGAALPGFVDSMAQAPVMQALGAGGSVAGSNLAKSEGLPPWAQLGMGMVGALAPGGAAMAGQRVGLGAKAALVDPFTQGGRELIAGNVFNQLATNPDLARQRLGALQPLVPGSLPTMSWSRDPGLIAAEGPMMASLKDARGSGRLALRQADQNQARNQMLDDLTMPGSGPIPEGGQPARGTLEYAQAKRDNTVENNMTPAFEEGAANRAEASQLGDETAAALTKDYPGSGYADTKPILDRITGILKTSIGARKDVQDAMAFARERLQQPNVDVTDPEVLYSIRKDLQNARDGKYNSDKTNLALAKGELADVIKTLDGAIDKAAPGFRRYLELYSKRSRALNQQQYIADLRARGRNSVTDPTHGEPVLTMGKFGTRVRNDLASGKMGPGIDNANLSEKQIDTLATIAEDIDRGSAKTAGTIKAPGSDTFHNLTVANIIGRVVGHGLVDTSIGKGVQSLVSPISFMYQLPEKAIQNILVEAALDPRLAARLMGNASKYEMDNIAKELAHIAMKQGLGATVHNQP